MAADVPPPVQTDVEAAAAAGAQSQAKPGAAGSTTSSKKDGKDDAGNERQGFSNTLEFVLTSLGLAVGLGNIWRFPTRAYENGGSAFLIPYLSCAFLFGLPALYLEFLVGQFHGTSAPILFRRIMPILEGIGYMGPTVAALVGIYYILIISWIVLYIIAIFRGHTSVWTKCDNDWNVKETCIDMISQELCNSPNPPGWSPNITLPEKFIYINGSCTDARQYEHARLLSATEQYFKYNILNPSGGLFEFDGVNWHILGSMTFCWILTGLLILKGMKIMGKISYFTVILPYVLVVLLFIRGVTLDGSGEGLLYYLGRPDFTKVFTTKAWSEALKQLCFSLSVGHGGLMNMASYNSRSSNCFINAATIIVADTMMSLVGGAAVFSTLGFLAKQRNVTVPEVVESGLSLAFVVYPEAMSQMPAPWLWSFLFFFMLFLLGVSTEIALTEAFCSCLYDQVKYFRERKWIVVTSWCTFLYVVGFVFSTKAGLYWFEMFDEYSAGFSAVVTVMMEAAAIVYLYGIKNFLADVNEMLGEAKPISKIIGSRSPYFTWNWAILIPLIGFVLIIFSFQRDYPFGGNGKMYPVFFDLVGWTLAFLPLLFFILYFAINYKRCKVENRPIYTIFMLQKQHPSFARISATYDDEKKERIKDLADQEPWDEDKEGKPAELSSASSTPNAAAAAPSAAGAPSAVV